MTWLSIFLNTFPQFYPTFQKEFSCSRILPHLSLIAHHAIQCLTYHFKVAATLIILLMLVVLLTMAELFRFAVCWEWWWWVFPQKAVSNEFPIWCDGVYCSHWEELVMRGWRLAGSLPGQQRWGYDVLPMFKAKSSTNSYFSGCVVAMARRIKHVTDGGLLVTTMGCRSFLICNMSRLGHFGRFFGFVADRRRKCACALGKNLWLESTYLP